MAVFKKRTMFVITAGIWIAAIGSAAALTYDLNRPLDLRTRGSGPSSPPAAMVEPPTALEETQVAQLVLQVPTVTVVASRPRPTPARTTNVAAAPVARDISEMRCASPRDLDMGSGQVTICE